MPTRPVSPGRSVRAWSVVYFRFAGYAIVSPRQAWRPALLLAFIERHRHDARAGAAAADVDVELGAGRVVVERQISRGDRALRVGRLRPAGDHAGLVGADVDVVAVAADAALEHLEARDL